MAKKLRVLAVAPYEGMEKLLYAAAGEFPGVELTVFVGERLQGVEIARANFHGNYDVVISRGNTAKMLREQIGLPVAEIPTTAYDLLCAFRLAGEPDSRTAVVTYAECAEQARSLCELMGYTPEILTTGSTGTMEEKLRELRDRGCRSVLCDTGADRIARELGMNSTLIVSGIDSIRAGFREALTVSSDTRRLGEENRFFRSLLRGQSGSISVFDESGELFFTTMDASMEKVQSILRSELEESRKAEERRVMRSADGVTYSIRSRRVECGDRPMTAFFVTARKGSGATGQTGVSYRTRAEAERDFEQSVFSYAGAVFGMSGEIARVSESRAPVMILGEEGTGRESVANALYVRGTLRDQPLAVIRCSLLSEKSRAWLLESHASPLADENITIYFDDIDALSEENLNQMLSALTAMDVCARSRVIFSCVCRGGQQITPAGILIRDELRCVSLPMPPLRELRSHIPELVRLTAGHLNALYARRIVGIEPDACSLLQNFSWPHNYSQFCRCLEELSVMASGTVITAEAAAEVLRRERHQGTFSQAESDAAPLDLSRTLDEINGDIAVRVIEECGGNLTAAASRLGISRTTLWRLRQKLDSARSGEE